MIPHSAMDTKANDIEIEKQTKHIEMITFEKNEKKWQRVLFTPQVHAPFTVTEKFNYTGPFEF